MITVQLQGTRTGSTYFYRCLDSHPDIDAHPEMFRISPEKFDSRFLNPNWQGEKVTTFKMMYNHVNHFKIFEMIKSLPVIHIIRTPYKKVLSDITYGIILEGVDKKYVNPDFFMHHLTKYKNLVDQHKQLKQFTDYIEIFTDDFIRPDSKMPGFITEAVTNFLGVDDFPMFSDTKYKDKKHWSYFENEDEIKFEILKEDEDAKF